MASLRGASAFVTGGGSGIGRAICVDLAKHGCHVTVCTSRTRLLCVCRFGLPMLAPPRMVEPSFPHPPTLQVADVSDAGARATADLAGPNATPVHCDVASSASQEAAFADHIRRNGGLDIAVLNAGISERGAGPEEGLWLDLWSVIRGPRCRSMATCIAKPT